MKIPSSFSVGGPEKEGKSNVSRRDFLKVAAVAFVGLVAPSGCATASPTKSEYKAPKSVPSTIELKHTDVLKVDPAPIPTAVSTVIETPKEEEKPKFTPSPPPEKNIVELSTGDNNPQFDESLVLADKEFKEINSAKEAAGLKPISRFEATVEKRLEVLLNSGKITSIETAKQDILAAAEKNRLWAIFQQYKLDLVKKGDLKSLDEEKWFDNDAVYAEEMNKYANTNKYDFDQSWNGQILDASEIITLIKSGNKILIYGNNGVINTRFDLMTKKGDVWDQAYEIDAPADRSLDVRWNIATHKKPYLVTTINDGQEDYSFFDTKMVLQDQEHTGAWKPFGESVRIKSDDNTIVQEWDYTKGDWKQNISIEDKEMKDAGITSFSEVDGKILARNKDCPIPKLQLNQKNLKSGEWVPFVPVVTKIYEIKGKNIKPIEIPDFLTEGLLKPLYFVNEDKEKKIVPGYIPELHEESDKESYKKVDLGAYYLGWTKCVLDSGKDKGDIIISFGSVDEKGNVHIFETIISKDYRSYNFRIVGIKDSNNTELDLEKGYNDVDKKLTIPSIPNNQLVSIFQELSVGQQVIISTGYDLNNDDGSNKLNKNIIQSVQLAKPIVTTDDPWINFTPSYVWLPQDYIK